MDHQGHNLARRTSIRLSHSALGKIRTPSLRIRSAAFCPLNYEGIDPVDRVADFDGVGCSVVAFTRHQTDYLLSSLSSRKTTMQI